MFDIRVLLDVGYSFGGFRNLGFEGWNLGTFGVLFRNSFLVVFEGFAFFRFSGKY